MLFENHSHKIREFYTSTGFLIPTFQREYSWDADNVSELLNDIAFGMAKLGKNAEYRMFLGVVILTDVCKPTLGVHFDNVNLVSPIVSVIDGQQRLSTLALIGSLIASKLRLLESTALIDLGEENQKFVKHEVNTLVNALTPLFLLDTTQVFNSSPNLKPRIIRHLDNSAVTEVYDKWTHIGDSGYRSVLARYLSQCGAQFPSLEYNNLGVDVVKGTQFEGVCKAIRNFLDEDLLQLTPEILDSGQFTYKRLYSTEVISSLQFASLHNLYRTEASSNESFKELLSLMLLSDFLLHGCFINSIKCPNEEMSFDLFQSLNSTGNPLTSIEVFKAIVVNKMGQSYPGSQASGYFHLIGELLSRCKKFKDKLSISNNAVRTLALLYCKKLETDNFRDQKEWLSSLFIDCEDKDWIGRTVQWLKVIIEFELNIRKAKKGGNDSVLAYLLKIGLSEADAKESAMLLHFLKEAGHAKADYIIILVLDGVLAFQSDRQSTSALNARKRFIDTLRQLTSFYILWRGIDSKDPDQVYNEFLISLSLSRNKGVLTKLEDFNEKLFRHFVLALGGEENLKSNWGYSAPKSLSYKHRQTVCRMLLFLSFNDHVPCESEPGLMAFGRPGSAEFLNYDNWCNAEFKSLEHVAPQTRPQVFIDPEVDGVIYDEDPDLIDSIGNLTLLSSPANSSIGFTWPEKAFYYAVLSTRSPNKSEVLEEKKREFGLERVPNSLPDIDRNYRFVTHLEPIVQLYKASGKWDADFIKKRAKNLCANAYPMLIKWFSNR